MNQTAELTELADRILRASLADGGHGLETAADCRPILAEAYTMITGFSLPVVDRRVDDRRRVPRVGLVPDRRSVTDLSARISTILEDHQRILSRLVALQRAAVARAAGRLRNLPSPLDWVAVERVLLDELGGVRRRAQAREVK